MKNSVCVPKNWIVDGLPDSIPEFVLLHRDGKSSGRIYCTPDSRREMVLGDDEVRILRNPVKANEMSLQ